MSDNPPSTDSQRLNKYLALSLGVSRRQADQLIEQGRVQVNARAVSLGARVQEGDTVTVDGKPTSEQARAYIALHKPVGYVCSRRRQGDAPTIYELLPSHLHSLKPVGRLDKDSSGIILLSNDGDFAYRMTHPTFKKSKRYLVRVDKPLQPLHRQMISDIGINLDDGKSQLTLSRQIEGDDTRWIVEMSEGRNRQIRRTFTALGYTVIKLHRTDFGNYSLGDIKRGEWVKIDIS